MAPQVKICGLKDQAGVMTALTGGAAWLGFVVFPRSPRHIEPADAAPLAALARGKAETVAVTVDADDALMGGIMEGFAPQWLQLHGSESPERAQDIAAKTGARIIKALAIAAPADLAAARSFEGAVDALLFDAKPPKDAARPGGWGAAFDWRLLDGRAITTPWLLSGGLTPGNITEAICITGATAVDVSSGVETAPGVKSPALIQEFLTAAHGSAPR